VDRSRAAAEARRAKKPRSKLNLFAPPVRASTTANPVDRFLTLLCSSISTGHTHLTTRDGGIPDNPGAWGWRTQRHATIGGPSACPKARGSPGWMVRTFSWTSIPRMRLEVLHLPADVLELSIAGKNRPIGPSMDAKDDLPGSHEKGGFAFVNWAH
jgi:hypothetical protein